MDELLAEIATLKARVDALEAEKRQSSSRLLSKREAARRLGIDRGTTLELLIETKQLRLVRAGKRERIPEPEVERLVREGYRLK
jgi:excisionase family DNA binding protein